MLIRSRLLRLLCALVLAVLAMAVGWVLRPAGPVPARAVVEAVADPVAVDVTRLHKGAQGICPCPRVRRRRMPAAPWACPPGGPSALTVFWFSGERESGPGVQIAASQWDRSMQAWSAPHIVANRHVLGAQLGHGVRRLGNPVAWMDADGRIHLFVVATGWGGWAASRILHLRQSSHSLNLDALEFSPVRVLPLSWLWNTSHLVRNPPLPLADGGMVLPVHFELGWKYPVALRFDAQGGFQGMVRMSARKHLLQPTLLAQSPDHWIGLLRDESANGKVGAVATDDGGQHWRDLPDLALDNPDASVGGMALGAGQMVLAHNSSPGSRARLDLSHSSDGVHWSLLATLASGAPMDEFSYPSMAWADNSLWISYTVDRQRLAWQRFAPGGSP